MSAAPNLIESVKEARGGGAALPLLGFLARDAVSAHSVKVEWLMEERWRERPGLTKRYAEFNYTETFRGANRHSVLQQIEAALDSDYPPLIDYGADRSQMGGIKHYLGYGQPLATARIDLRVLRDLTEAPDGEWLCELTVQVIA